MSYGDSEREGQEAYRRDRHSHETSERLDAGRYYGSESDREFLEGYQREERRDRERREEEREVEEARERAAANRRSEDEFQEQFE